MQQPGLSPGSVLLPRKRTEWLCKLLASRSALEQERGTAGVRLVGFLDKLRHALMAEARIFGNLTAG
jgi:hypothetical protein